MKIGTPLTPSALRVMLLGAGELGKEVVPLAWCNHRLAVVRFRHHFLRTEMSVVLCLVCHSYLHLVVVRFLHHRLQREMLVVSNLVYLLGA